MTPEAAAWVYEHVLVGYHDANERTSLVTSAAVEQLDLFEAVTAR